VCQDRMIKATCKCHSYVCKRSIEWFAYVDWGCHQAV